MSQWRREAIERFPELHREIADAYGIYDFWLIVRNALFKPAYEKEPSDTKTLARVYDYAYWCFHHRSKTVRLAVADEFYERLRDDPRMRRDMPNWISSEDFNNLHFAWDYYLTQQAFAEFRQEFFANKERIDKQKIAKHSRLGSDAVK